MAMWLVGAIWGLLHWFLGPENPESSAFKLRPKDARRRTPAKVQALEGWHKFFGRSHEQRPESRLLWLPALCRSRWVSDFFGCHTSSDLGPEERFRSRCQKTVSTDQNSQCACRCGKRPLTSVRNCGAERMNVRNAEGKTEQRVRLSGPRIWFSCSAEERVSVRGSVVFLRHRRRRHMKNTPQSRWLCEGRLDISSGLFLTRTFPDLRPGPKGRYRL